ncbi:MAG: leucyl aminopeptidase [Planctomycetota bacterium]
MKVSFKKGSAAAEVADLLALPVYKLGDKGSLKGVAAAIDKMMGGVLSQLVAGGDFKGDRDSCLMVPNTSAKLKAKRVALLGLGDKGDGTPENLRRAAAVMVKNSGDKIKKIAIVADDLGATAKSAAGYAQALIEGAQLARYRFDRFMDKKKPGPDRLALVSEKDALASNLRNGVKVGNATAAGNAFARDLGNLPGNFGQPRVLAAEAKKMAKKVGLSAKVLGKSEMEKAGMGSLLSVALGSKEEAKLIVLEHNKGKKNLPTICLVGKGLTFDSGGISIKPSGDMDKMRYDKCGGCTVLGTMLAVAELNLPLHVVGIVPSSENMPGENANKPGDIVKASNGKTIQILNTDAEGRLILADALVYAQKFKPDAIVDLATLTGACMVALGQHCCGLMTRHDDLARELVHAGEGAHERAWRLPLWDEYSDEMKGDSSDLKNLGGRFGGALTAGAFLENFTDNARWAHLDIAGVSWDDSHRPYNRGSGATGFGVRLLVQYLRNLTS